MRWNKGVARGLLGRGLWQGYYNLDAAASEERESATLNEHGTQFYKTLYGVTCAKCDGTYTLHELGKPKAQ